MPKNIYRGRGGRSAVARSVKFGGPSGSNGMMPQGSVTTSTGEVVKNARYFGGMKKGGLAPSATGFMMPMATAPASRGFQFSLENKNFLSNFRQFYYPANMVASGPSL